MFGWVRDVFGRNTTAVSPAVAEARARLLIAQERFVAEHTRAIKARYDNAMTTPDNFRQWLGADYMSAKSANNFQVRRQLRMRSRYELSNNPYLWGVCNNNADDLIGKGPTLKVLTKDAGYNRAVETAWREWYQEVDYTEKLRTCKLAKSVDGEGFSVLKAVADLKNPVKLYPCDTEADQVTTPAPNNLEQLWVDGLELHPVTGRPTSYHILKHHPGDYYFPDFSPLAVAKVPARWVIHWFPKWRPGQVRGVPIFTPSLDLFTELRAYRKAVLGAAEIAADFAAVMEQETPADPEDDPEGLMPFKRVPIERKMMTSLPAGAKMNQFDAKQPTTTYEMFQEKCLGEAVRPLSYPLNLALGTSQKFNFSSSKLDIVNYYESLDVERQQCETVVLDPTFARWHEEAVLEGAIPVGPGADRLAPPPHAWHWPAHPEIDRAVDTQADADQIAGGQQTLQEFWARRGSDWLEKLEQFARERDELERLKLQFGEPTKKTITDNQDDPNKPPAKGRRGPERITAFDESKVKRKDDGEFGEGVGNKKTGSDKLEPKKSDLVPSHSSDTGSIDRPRELAHHEKQLKSKIKRFGKKAVETAKAIGRKAVEYAARATWAAYSAKVYADDIADTAHDYSKIINDKGMAAHLGLPAGGSALAAISSHLIAFGITKLKGAIAKRHAGEKDAAKASSGMSPIKKAKAVADLLAVLLPALGCDRDDLPTTDEVHDWIEEKEPAHA